MNSCSRAALAATIMFSFATQSFAASTVYVTESGEGGGAMSITVDKPVIASGDVVFKVTNGAMTEDHEMILVKLNSPNQKIPLVAAKHRVDESKLKTLGEVADLQPAAHGELKATLAPGDYMLLCNIKGHYEAGMAARIQVTANTASN